MIRTAQLIAARRCGIVDLMGPTIEFLTPPDADDDVPCLMRGTIPPGVAVPMHSHADVETFLALAGQLEGLVEAGGSFRWVPIKAGDVFHVPGNARHGFRNRSQENAVALVVSTQRIGRFFREIGKPLAPGVVPEPPSPETIARFLETSARYGYWNATPEENAKVGIEI